MERRVQREMSVEGETASVEARLEQTALRFHVKRQAPIALSIAKFRYFSSSSSRNHHQSVAYPSCLQLPSACYLTARDTSVRRWMFATPAKLTNVGVGAAVISTTAMQQRIPQKRSLSASFLCDHGFEGLWRPSAKRASG